MPPSVKSLCLHNHLKSGSSLFLIACCFPCRLQMTAETASITRNFLVEDDDLVDELLSAINRQGWGALKMEYQFSKLCAMKKSSLNNGSGSHLLTLAAEWTEFDEEMQLRISIAGDAS